MVNSRQKGARGERAWAQFCREQGFKEARRGVQYSGIGGADVVGLPGIHVEVKRVERFSLYDSLNQSKRDAKDGEIPIVAHRKNHCRWVVIMDAEDWFQLYREWLFAQEVVLNDGKEAGATSDMGGGKQGGERTA